MAHEEGNLPARVEQLVQLTAALDASPEVDNDFGAEISGGAICELLRFGSNLTATTALPWRFGRLREFRAVLARTWGLMRYGPWVMRIRTTRCREAFYQRWGGVLAFDPGAHGSRDGGCAQPTKGKLQPLLF